MYPHAQGVKSKAHSLKLFSEQKHALEEQAGLKPIEFVAEGGDIVIVPKHFAHATINIEAGIGLA